MKEIMKHWSKYFGFLSLSYNQLFDVIKQRNYSVLAVLKKVQRGITV